MRTTIDGAGRVVIPKAVRDRLELHAGQELEVREVEGIIEVAPVPSKVTLEQRGRGVVAVPDGDLPALTDDIVRTTLERSRR